MSKFHTKCSLRKKDLFFSHSKGRQKTEKAHTREVQIHKLSCTQPKHKTVCHGNLLNAFALIEISRSGSGNSASRADIVSVSKNNRSAGSHLVLILSFLAFYHRAHNPTNATQSQVIQVRHVYTSVCVHAKKKRYAWARTQRRPRAAEDKCLFNWSQGQTALALWRGLPIFLYRSDNLSELHLIVGPL